MSYHLSDRWSFWVTTGIVAHILWTSAAPAMAYPLYAQEWNLTPSVTTGIFAVYFIVVVAILIAFGDLSDYLGRRRTMLLGLLASTVGVLLFALAENVEMLFAGRILMGVGVGLSAGPSSAALLEYAGKNGTQRASAATIGAQAAGFTLALLVGGYLTQYAPYPTKLSFLVLFGLLLVLLVATFFLHDTETPRRQDRWRPRLPSVPSEVRGTFTVASVTVMTAYTHGVTISSLGAQIAKELVQSPNVFENSLMLSMFPITLGLMALFTKSFAAGRAAIAGSVLSIIGTVFLVGAVLHHSLFLFVPATAASGAGYALMVYGGLSLISAAAPEGSKGGILSAVYLLAYLFTGILAIVLGRVATIFGMTTAALSGATSMVVLCTCTILLVSNCMQKSARRSA